MNAKRVIALFFCFTVIAGCESSVEENKPEETGVIMPLNVGNQWIYRAFVLDSNGQQLPDNVMEIPIRVHRDTIIGGSSWLMLDSFFDKEKKVHFQNRQDGAWFEHSGHSGIFFRYPATANTSYTAPDDGTINVVSTNKSITVPAGTFSCYEYSMADVDKPSFVIRYYLAKNVGIVKLTMEGDDLDVYDGEDGPATIVYELKSHSLK